MSNESSVDLACALRGLESAIDSEPDASVLRAVRDRLVTRLSARIEALEVFTVILFRPSGDQKQLTGCLPDDRLEHLRSRAAKEFEIPPRAILLCQGSRQFGTKDMQMSLSDLGISDSAELTCLHDPGCRMHWRLCISVEGSEWEARIYQMELYDQYDTLVQAEQIDDVTSNAERNDQNIARNVFDGRPETFWETTFGSQKVGGWVNCTFREPLAIHRIRLQQFEHPGNCILAFDLFHSDDGIHWTYAWTAAPLQPGWSEASAPSTFRPVG